MLRGEDPTMITSPRSVALSAAVLIGLTGVAMPVAHAQPADVVTEATADVPGVSPDGDRSQGCTLDWEASGDLPVDGGINHQTKVYNPYEGNERTSAGALEVHGWATRHIRIPLAAAFPIEAGATLTVTLPEGASEDTVTFAESADNWIIERYYGAPYVKGSVDDYLGSPTWDGNTVTFTTTQRIPKNTAFDLRFTATGEQLVGETRVNLVGRWDPLQVELARDAQNGHAVPDCARPATEVVDGNRTQLCDVEWFADAVLDRRFRDWTNNGFIHKIKSPHQTDAPADATAPGSMEVQHYFTGNNTLWLRIPVGTDADMSDARLVVDLPEVEGYQWAVNSTGDPRYPVGDYDPTEPLPQGEIEGNQAIYEIGDFPADTAFTVYLSMEITPEEFDELTVPGEDGEWSNLFHPTATLTGEYAEGDENCVIPEEPGGSSPLAGSALLSGLAGSALLSSGGTSSAVPDLDSSAPDSPAPEAPAPEVPAPQPAPPADGPATGPVDSPDPKAQAQMQALNARPVAHADQPAAPAQGHTAPVTTAAQQQSQLANTGVAGALKVAAAGLLAAVLGGVLLVLRRRA